jgi:hypothetical protein
VPNRRVLLSAANGSDGKWWAMPEVRLTMAVGQKQRRVAQRPLSHPRPEGPVSESRWRKQLNLWGMTRVEAYATTTEQQLGNDAEWLSAHGMAERRANVRRVAAVFGGKGRPSRNNARDKSWLRPLNRLQCIAEHRVFAVRGRAGMLGLWL